MPPPRSRRAILWTPISRALAEALADPKLRRKFWEDLRDSPFPKHKLHLKSYLKGTNGSALLDAGAEATGKPKKDLRALLDSLPELEIALPIELHRLRWTGAEDVTVAGSSLPARELGERGFMTGYTSTGESVILSLFEYVEPQSPLVTLTRVETDFGADPEAKRKAAPKKSRGTISTPEEEFSVQSTTECDPDTAIVECDTSGGGGSSGGTSPAGYKIPSGYTYQCFVAAYAAGDNDGDGILNSCEYEITRAFRPYLSLSWYDDDVRREEYWAVRRVGTYSVMVIYALAYYSDGGSPINNSYKHLGDSEFIIMEIEYANGYWRLVQAKLSAHWGAPTNSTGTHGYGDFAYPDGTYRGRPLVWVAEDKHANYDDEGSCDAGARWTDNCDHNSYRSGEGDWTTEILSNANLGRDGHRLVNCVNSREGRPGQECFWTIYSSYFGAYLGPRFRGWYGSSDQEDAGPYYDVLSAHGF